MLLEHGHADSAKRILLIDIQQHITDMMMIHHTPMSFAYNPMHKRVTPEIDRTCDHVKLPVIQFAHPKLFINKNGLFNCIGISQHTATFICMKTLEPTKKFFVFNVPAQFKTANRNIRNKANYLLDFDVPYKTMTLQPMSGIVLSPKQEPIADIYELGTELTAIDDGRFHVADLKQLSFPALVAVYQLTECASYMAEL